MFYGSYFKYVGVLLAWWKHFYDVGIYFMWYVHVWYGMVWCSGLKEEVLPMENGEVYIRKKVCLCPQELIIFKQRIQITSFSQT